MAKKSSKKEVLTLEEKLEKALVPVSEQPYKVPENWVWVRLGDISEIVTGGTPSKKNDAFYGGIFPFFKPTDLDQGRNVFTAQEYLTEEGKENSRVVPQYSTSVCCIGSIGKCGYLEREGTTNQQINTIIYKHNGLFMYYLCCSDTFISQLNQKSSATTISIINKTKMSDILIPLPPLAEQTRIVSRIESLFSKLDEARELIESSLNRFEERKSAILHKAFSGELTKKWREENGVGFEWEETQLSKISKIVRGGSPRPAGDERFYNGEIPFLKVADLTKNNEKFVFAAQYSIKEAGLKKTRLVPQGTLLLTNSGATLGVPKITQIETTFNDGIAAFLELSDDVEFLFYFLTNQTTAFRSINKGAAQPNLNTDIIGETNIHLPSLPEQEEIVRILDDVLGKEGEAKELLNLLEKIDLMKKAILGRAFRGELGTNRGDEESAETLLKEVLSSQ